MIPLRPDRPDPYVAPLGPQSASQFYQVGGRKVFADNAECHVVYKHISYRNHQEIRIYKGVATFTNNFKMASTTYNINILLNIQKNTSISKEPVRLGDHLRRRRLELGLYQKDVAIQIGVTTSTIWNWEHGWTIDLRYIPRVIEFLGFNPIPCPDDI